MVAAALLFGELNYEMYKDDFSGLNQIENLRKKIVVNEDITLLRIIMIFQNAIFQTLLKLYIMTILLLKKLLLKIPIGHPSRREEAVPLLKEKFIKNVQDSFSKEKANNLWDQVINLKKDDELTKFFNILESI